MLVLKVCVDPRQAALNFDPGTKQGDATAGLQGNRGTPLDRLHAVSLVYWTPCPAWRLPAQGHVHDAMLQISSDKRQFGQKAFQECEVLQGPACHCAPAFCVDFA